MRTILNMPRNLYLLVSDGHRGIFLDTDGHVSLPCKTHWPIVRKAPKAWATPLFQHVTYGLRSLTFTKHKRPFGLPRGAAFKTAVVDAESLDAIVRDVQSVRRWHHHHANYECPWRLTILELTTTAVDLPSTHCLRALTETT